MANKWPYQTVGCAGSILSAPALREKEIRFGVPALRSLRKYLSPVSAIPRPDLYLREGKVQVLKRAACTFGIL